ncbi:MAG: hypothetical protein ABSG98_04195 [Anaerolineales bacterium]
MTDENASIPTGSGPGCGGVALYILSGVVSLFTAGMVALYGLIFINPNVPFNPFPPATLPATAALPSLTATSMLVLPPTWTPTATFAAQAAGTDTATLPPGTLAPTQTPVVELSSTATILPTDTATVPPTATATALPDVTPSLTSTATVPPTATATALPSATPSPTYTPTETPYPVALSSSGVVAMQAPDPRGCSYAGVAGQVFGPNNGAPIIGLLIHLQGKWGSKTFNANGTAGAPPDAVTGTATTFGPGGYELVLGTAPVASQGTLWIQVRDANGQPLSALVGLTTYADCTQNLLLVNFNQVH